MEIKRLRTADEIAELIAFRDDTPDALMECDYGQYVQWMTAMMPNHPQTMAVFAAIDGLRIVGYIAVVYLDGRPLYDFGTVIRLACREPDALRPLGNAALDWGRERGVKRIVVSVYDERARQLYERVFGFRQCGWQLSMEI